MPVSVLRAAATGAGRLRTRAAAREGMKTPHLAPHLDRPDRLDRTARQRRDTLRKAITTAFAGELEASEIDNHFTQMPARYWTQATAEVVARHLELIHEFFLRLNGSDEAGTACIVRWQSVPARGVTTIELCTWDRLGLLAKVAGALAAVGLNIVRADIFTRTDNVALDVFQVAEPTGSPVQHEARLRHMAALLAAALKPGGALPARGAWPHATGPVAVDFDDSYSAEHTVLLVEAPDRVGLLSDIFTTLAAQQVNIAHAIITTDNGRAGDVFYLTDDANRALPAGDRQEQLRGAICGVLG